MVNRYERVYRMPFSRIYPLYLEKIERKGHTQAELDQIITWLTGYSEEQLQKQISTNVDLRTFFAAAPQMNPNAKKITGVICGVRVETLTDPLMQQVRWLDKLVDELARNKKLVNILRS